MAGALAMLMGAAAAAPLGASISGGSSITESIANAGQTTGESTVTATGGVSPYAYDWEYVSGDAGIFAVSDTAAVTKWTSSSSDVVENATWRCKVTDDVSAVTYSNNVLISLTVGSPP